jgi:hypothetical protein
MKMDAVQASGQAVQYIQQVVADWMKQTGRYNLSDADQGVLMIRGMDHIQRGVPFNVEAVTAIVDAFPTSTNSMPHATDKQLDWLLSIEDYVEADREKIRRYLQPAALGEMTRDASGRSLKERFDDRVQWLQANKVRRAKEQVTAAPTKPLTEREKLVAKANADVAAIRAEIDSIPNGYRAFVVKQKERLHRILNEMLAERKTIGEIKIVMERELREKDSPIR